MGNFAASIFDGNDWTASAKRWARGLRLALSDNVRSRRGEAVKSVDHALWERELAEYLGLHPDLENLPPPVFPRRRSRLGRWLWLYRQDRRARRARRGGGSRALLIIMMIMLLVLETLLLGAIAGWWMGWHL
jgi:hypothetical protein